MTEPTLPSKGIKLDQGKLRWDLVPFDMLQHLTRVSLCESSREAIFDDTAYMRLFAEAMTAYQQGYKSPERGIAALEELTVVSLFLVAREITDGPVRVDTTDEWWEYFGLDPIEAVLKVLTFGVKKYSAWNWVYVPDRRARYFAAAWRHQMQRLRGETIDTETGVHHSAHICCCLWFLLASEMKVGDPRFDKWLFELEAESSGDPHVG
jgi:hypothetical protein